MSSSIQCCSPRNDNCNNEGTEEKKSPSVFDFFVFIRVRDWIRILSSATDFQLFWIGVGVRLIISVSMVAVFSIPGYFLDYSTNKSLFRDNSFLFFDDRRLFSLRMWDAVHFFSVASEGYDLEVKFAFFPGFPALLKVIVFLTSDVFSILSAIFPVVFYVMLLNLTLNGLTLVLLRKLTILTFLGPMGMKCFQHKRFKWTKVSYWVAQTGSMFDTPLCTQDPLLIKKGKAVDWKIALKEATAATARHRSDVDVLIGAACFLWVIIPPAVHSSVAYTEPVFGYLTLLFIYLLHRDTKELPGIDETNIEEIEGVEEQLWELYYSGKPVEKTLSDHLTARSLSTRASISATAPRDVNKPEGRIKVKFKQDLVSKNELLAEILLILTGTIRSNTILCTGFFWYPIFIQLFLPSLYRRRVLEWYAPQWWGVGSEKNTEGNTKKKKSVYDAKTGTTTIIIHGVHGLDRKISFCRLLVLLLYTVMAFVPFLYMNYLGWTTYGPFWGKQEKELYGTSFFHFYASIQDRFWDVGLLRSITFENIPHCLVPLPLCATVFLGLRHILCSDLPSALTVSENKNVVFRWSCRSILNTFKLELIFLYSYAERILSSASITLLLLQIFIGLFLMNIHVLPRFVMALPSLYWMVGSVFARMHSLLITRVVPFVFVGMILVGITLFSLNYDWT